jgi:hypothetical protein
MITMSLLLTVAIVKVVFSFACEPDAPLEFCEPGEQA